MVIDKVCTSVELFCQLGNINEHGLQDLPNGFPLSGVVNHKEPTDKVWRY